MHKILAKTLFIGKKTIFLPECPSTNSTAMEFIKNGSAGHGTIIITDNQTAGRGQRGNQWHTFPGQNLTCSLILKPTFIAPSQQFQLHFMVSLAIADAMKKFEIQPLIKWPNDIYVEHKKVAGILIENSLRGGIIEYSIIGVGINVNQVNFSGLSNAGSLTQITGNPIDRQTLLESVMLNMEKYYLQLKSGNAAHLKEKYLDNMLGYQRALKFEDKDGPFTGIIQGVTNSGRLRLLKEGCEQQYDLKEVKYLIE